MLVRNCNAKRSKDDERLVQNDASVVKESLWFGKNSVDGMVQEVLSRSKVRFGETSHDSLTRSSIVQLGE